MAFVLELHLSSKQNYIKNYIVSIIRMFNINTNVSLNDYKLLCAFTSKHEKLSECLELIAQELPASFFLKASKSYENDEEPNSLPNIDNSFTLNLGLCPFCQKDMFDVTSRRYYYPFTSCTCCGANNSFVNTYPYERKNTSFKFIVPCSACDLESKSVGFKEKHVINSCHSCGVPVRLVNKTRERYANDAGSFRTMFEVAAKALQDNKKVLIKTTMGYRLFYKAIYKNFDSILMMINAEKITDNLSLISEEFNALLSIERPILNVTLKDDILKEIYGANTVYAKYPDDGFCILLGAELIKLGLEYIAYEDCDENSDSDMFMDYDLEINPQSDIRIFLNKDISFIAEGERISFPSKNFLTKPLLSVANDLIAIEQDRTMFLDSMEHFHSIKVDKVNVLEGDKETYHSNQRQFSQDEASFMSVIAEHNAFDKSCVGAYFDEEPSFLYYDTKNVLRIIPPKHFEASHLLEDIINLREGSDRLVENMKNKMPKVYESLLSLENKKNVKLFEATAIILGLEDKSMRGVTTESMKFIGKGGIQIDTHISDNRFDHGAFLASIISYQLAGVSTSILSYSIFESFGDYFNDILQELKSKTKATEIVLCGSHFSNQSLFSRMQKNLKMSPPLMNKDYPIGKKNAVLGGIYL